MILLDEILPESKEVPGALCRCRQRFGEFWIYYFVFDQLHRSFPGYPNLYSWAPISATRLLWAWLGNGISKGDFM